MRDSEPQASSHRFVDSDIHSQATSMNSRLASVLRIAALYNIAWGAWQVLAPNSFFELMGMEPINHPMVWQGMGMVCAGFPLR